MAAFVDLFIDLRLWNHQMTLFIFKTPDGKWRVTHLPPRKPVGEEFMLDNFGDALMVMTADDHMPVFMDRKGNEVSVEIGD